MYVIRDYEMPKSLHSSSFVFAAQTEPPGRKRTRGLSRIICWGWLSESESTRHYGLSGSRAHMQNGMALGRQTFGLDSISNFQPATPGIGRSSKIPCAVNCDNRGSATGVEGVAHPQTGQPRVQSHQVAHRHRCQLRYLSRAELLELPRMSSVPLVPLLLPLASRVL